MPALTILPKTCPACLRDALVVTHGTVKCTACSIYQVRAKWWQVVYAWTFDKYWWLRLPVYLWMCYSVAQYLRVGFTYIGNRIGNPINAIDFGMHELGHFLFIPLGEFMTIAGGSITQVLFPLVWVGIAIWKRWYFAAGLCLVWVGLSLIDVSIYAGDAQIRMLPLVALGGDYDSAHDWYQLLTRRDMLDQASQIAQLIRASGVVSIVAGLIWSGLLLVSMCVASFKRWTTRSEELVQ